MNRPTTAATVAAICLAVAACTGTSAEGPEPDVEAAAHEALRDHLGATAAGDWAHVYELTAHESRPADRTGWIEQRSGREGGFVDRCVGDTAGRPDIELDTLDHDAASMVIEALVWTRDDQGTVCHWRVIEEPTGWRVEGHIDRVRRDGGGAG